MAGRGIEPAVRTSLHNLPLNQEGLYSAEISFDISSLLPIRDSRESESTRLEFESRGVRIPHTSYRQTPCNPPFVPLSGVRIPGGWSSNPAAHERGCEEHARTPTDAPLWAVGSRSPRCACTRCRTTFKDGELLIASDPGAAEIGRGSAYLA